MDKLEKYIRENRASFDDKNPPVEVWHKINHQLDKGETSQIHMGSLLWRAAAIFLFAMVVWLLMDRADNINQETQIPLTEDTDRIAFNDVEAFYSMEIERKQKLILHFVSENPELDTSLLEEIDQLDSTYQVLKSTAENGYSERILDAMVINLQMRIDILNQQLEVLGKIKNLKENEKVDM
jgi:hypothetical protein